MRTIAQYTHEAVLGSHMQVQTSTDDQTNQADSIGHHLDGLAGGAERRGCHPLSCPSIHHKREGQVCCRHDSHTYVKCLSVFGRISHLTDHGQESTSSSRRDEDCRRCNNAGCESYSCRYGVVTELIIASLGSSGGSVESCDSYHDDKNRDKYGYEASPSEPAYLLELPDGGCDSDDYGG